MATLQNIPRITFSHPRRNLPDKSGNKVRERNFTISFARSYLEGLSNIHRNSTRTSSAFVRELPVREAGIADLVAAFWNSDVYESEKLTNRLPSVGQTTLRAFESKIYNWKEALSQAVRYQRFADASIVVLPYQNLNRAIEYLDTFKKIHVGLWGYDEETENIITKYTPRPRSPWSKEKRLKAFKMIARHSKTLPNP